MEILPTIDPALMGAIWGIILVVRGIIPDRFISIDGKETIWTIALVASAIALTAKGEFEGVNDLQGVAQAVTTTFVTAAGAILTDGAAKASGLSETLRNVVTIGGRTNTP